MPTIVHVPGHVGACLQAIASGAVAETRRQAVPRGAALRPALLALGALLIAPIALSAATVANPAQTPMDASARPAPPDDSLPKLVAELSQQKALSAEDCARLAQETIAHGQAARQSGQPANPGVIGDGLAAVERGESLDAHAANWPDLRRQLEELLRPPPQQDQQKQDEQKKDEEKKNEQQQENQQEQQQQDQKNQDQKSDEQKQQQQQEEKQQEQQKQEQQQSEQQKQEEQQQQEKQSEAEQQQAKPDEPKKDTQKIGGEQEPDDERREHPELAVQLQKLDEVREQDSPAKLFQLLQNEEPRAPDQPKKDW